MTQEEKFLEKAKNKFGDKFDYSKVDYVNSTTPVIIICPIHGEFEVKPVQFLQSKYGCKKCSIEESHKKLTRTTEQFIQKAKEIWGDKYTYEKTDYVNSLVKVIITCPEHGDFLTRPSDFLKHHGCPKCKGDRTREFNKRTKRFSQEQFLDKVTLLYGNLFSYENARYINKRTKIIVHSNLLNEDFVVSPGDFFTGKFPAKYRGETIVNNYSYTTEEFRKIASIIRPEYDYSQSVYKSLKTKVKVICPKHGEFEITPCNLLYNNEGCPKCNRSKGEEFVEKTLLELNISYKSQYKLIINNTTLYVDFFIVKNNKLYFIEYNGLQHYEPVEYFGGEEKFKKQQARDNLLREYCKNNNIVLLEYKYDIPFYKLSQIIKNDLNNE